jgi:5'-nucleotidase
VIRHPELAGLAAALMLAALGLAPAASDAERVAERSDAPPAVPSASPWPPPAVTVSWSDTGSRPGSTVHLRLLGFNDFHGNLEPPALASGRAAGGASVLAAYLENAERASPGHTLILEAGDLFGASPPITRLLGNEPAVRFLDLLADAHCPSGAALHFYDAGSWRRHPDRCNVIGTVGNHEFDAGVPQLLRLLSGSRVPFVCANVRDRRTGQPLLPPYAVVMLGDVPVGVIGAVVRDTPTLVPAWATKDIEFLDEADAINRAAAELVGQGVHTLIVLIHQGLVPARASAGLEWRGALRDIVARLDPGIDVVVSGHTHQYADALLPDRGGRPVLVTQAYSAGVAYADIELEVNRSSGKVVRKSAQIVPAWADDGPGQRPDPRVAELTATSAAAVAPQIARVVATLPAPITRATTAAGESALGDLVADAQRAATHADVALMNPGGLRTDLKAGPLTWGDVLTLHPFGNRLVTLRMTGAQLLEVLEQQWPEGSAMPRILKTSGLTYAWDATRPHGHRVTAACDGRGTSLDSATTYRVTVSDFLAGGGDGFTGFAALAEGELGPLDSEALASYLTVHPEAVQTRVERRIVRSDAGTAASATLPDCALAR